MNNSTPPPPPWRYIDAQQLRQQFFPAPSLRTIREWTKSRILPSVKIGGKRYYDAEAVTRKIEERLTLHAREDRRR